MRILCSIATRGRYHTTLPAVIQAVMNQTRLPDRLVIFDDNDEPKDMREEFIYQNLFRILDAKGIDWQWLFAGKKGQHHIHQSANMMGYDWVWRVDDDAVPEPNVLETLANFAFDGVGAVGGSILTPFMPIDASKSTGKIDNIDTEPNIQWGKIKERKDVEHLHCSFLYRAGVHDYHLGLSRVAHREETLFTYGLFNKGYRLLIVPNAVTWHLKNPEGGIRSESKEEMYHHDEQIYRNFLCFRGNTICVITGGLGDHIVLSSLLDHLHNPIVFGCYPEVIPCKSIAEAEALFGNLEQWDVYKKMHEWGWTGTLLDAYKKLYL